MYMWRCKRSLTGTALIERDLKDAFGGMGGNIIYD